MPWYLQVAIEHAMTVMTWYENLQKAEVPPEYLWEDSEGLEQWWARIDEKRSDGTVGEESARMSVPDGDDDQDPPQGMAENSYARALKQG